MKVLYKKSLLLRVVVRCFKKLTYSLNDALHLYQNIDIAISLLRLLF